MAAKKLNQVLAVEKTVKAKREDEITALYQNVQKAELSIGFSRTYLPLKDDGEKLPPESKKVQVRVNDVLKQMVDLNKEIFNVTAQKDATNCLATVDIVVEGETLAKGVPATHLLWMEKKLLMFQEFIAKLPTLPQDTVWSYDEGQGLYRSDPTSTIKTKKVEDVVVVPGTLTKDHPAQTWKKTEDINIGTWTTTHLSGAIPVDRKKQLLARIEKFMKAVKEAREEANQTPVAELATGVIVERIFAP